MESVHRKGFLFKVRGKLSELSRVSEPQLHLFSNNWKRYENYLQTIKYRSDADMGGSTEPKRGTALARCLSHFCCLNVLNNSSR